MKNRKIFAAVAMATALVITAFAPAIPAEAATTNTFVSYIGGSEGANSVTEITINGKTPAKMSSALKKQVEVDKRVNQGNQSL